MRPRLTFRRLVLFVMLAMVLVLAAVEIAARLFIPSGMQYVSEERFWQLLLHSNLFGQFDRVDRIEVQHLDLRADGPGVEERFFPKEKAPGRRRIICLGSSSTFGAGLRHWSQVYPAKLETMLRDRGHNVEVINAGFGGYNSYQLWIYLSEVLIRLHPDLVIFYYGGNEGYGSSAKTFYPRAQAVVARLRERGVTDSAELSYAVEHGTAGRWALGAFRLLDHSRAVLWLRNRIVEGRIAGELVDRRLEPNDPRYLIEPTFETILQQMADLLREHGGRLILCPEAAAANTAVRAGDRTTFAMLQQCKKGGALCLDVLQQPPGIADASLFLDSSHLTEEGHERLAATLLPVVERALALQAPAGAPAVND